MARSVPDPARSSARPQSQVWSISGHWLSMFFKCAACYDVAAGEIWPGGRMHESTPDAIWVHSIDLAQEADFDLGLLRVRPASCEVEWNGVSQTLQRRVMQVLVALARAQGSVVSQDDLVVRCWRGLSVSDDAIFRCISKLRKLAAGYPDAPFAIETIPGVGYRLTSPSLVEHDPAGRARWRGLTSSRPSRMGGRGRACDPGPDGCGGLDVLRPAPERPSASRRGPAVRNTEHSADARSLARRIPNEIVNEFGDSQIEAVLAGERAGKEVREAARSAGTDRDGNSARRWAQHGCRCSASRMVRPVLHCGRR